MHCFLGTTDSTTSVVAGSYLDDLGGERCDGVLPDHGEGEIKHQRRLEEDRAPARYVRRRWHP